MTVLKIYNNKTSNYVGYIKILIFCFLPSNVIAAQEVTGLTKPIDTSNLLMVVLGLTIVLLLFFGLVFVLKKLPTYQGRKSGLLKIMDTIYFGTNEKIILLEVGGQQIVVGINSQSMDTLHVLDEPIITNDTGSDLSFKEKLSGIMPDSISSSKNS